MPFCWRFFPLHFCLVTSPHCPNLEIRIKIIKEISHSNLNSGFFRQTCGTLIQSEVDYEEIRKYLNFIQNLMQFPVPLSFCLTLSTEAMGQQPWSCVQMLSFKLFLWHTSQSFCNRFSRREVLILPSSTSAKTAPNIFHPQPRHVLLAAFCHQPDCQAVGHTDSVDLCNCCTLLDCFWRLTSAFTTGKKSLSTLK